MPVLFPSEPPAVLLSPYWLLCRKKWQQRYENACEWAARGFCSVLSVLAVTVWWGLGAWWLGADNPPFFLLGHHFYGSQGCECLQLDVK